MCSLKIPSSVVLVSLTFGGAGFAATVNTVVPAAQANTLGNGQSTLPLRNYGTGGSRFQQVYGSSLFGGLSDAESISAVSFRAKQAAIGSFIGNSVSVTNVLITLSTTSANDADTLSGSFASNVGADVKTVYSGSLTLTSPTTGNTSFGYVINLQSPFVYQKAKGNLLLDILIPDSASVSGNGSIGFAQFDTFTDAFPSADGIGTASGSSGSAMIGSNSTLGLVTQFTSAAVAVPEPTALAAIVVPALMVGRRKR